MRRQIPALLAAILACWCAAPPAFASLGSISPPSHWSDGYSQSDVVPVDAEFVDGRPCLLQRVHRTKRYSYARVACRFGIDASIDHSSPRITLPVALDVNDTFIYAVGSTREVGSTVDEPWLVRIGRTGKLDYTFTNDTVKHVAALRPDGLDDVKFVDVEALPNRTLAIAGSAYVGPAESERYVPFVTRVLNDGTIDSAFGTDGIATISVEGHRFARITSMRALADGTTLVVGSTAADATTRTQPFAALLDASGAPVPTFGSNGVALPDVGPGASWFYQLPKNHSGSLPIVVSASLNTRGKVRPFVVKLTGDGSLVPGWGGATSHSITTLHGDPSMLQGMPIELARDGTIYGAGELAMDGDTDSFVARFKTSNGRPDERWGLYGFEPTDTVPGAHDSEWTAAIAINPRTQLPVVAGAHIGRGGRIYSHSFSTRPKAAGARRRDGWIASTTARGVVRGCGRSAKRPCVVTRGTRLHVATVFPGWAAYSPFDRPVFHVWSKPLRGEWRHSERPRSSTHRYRQQMVGLDAIALPRGMHRIFAARNGNHKWSWGITSYLYVTVR